MKLKVILGSTRPGRKGLAIAEWFMDEVKGFAGFETELLDLAVIDLPLLDEEGHPRLKQYKHDHTWAWSRKIDEADAFVFVTAEYNTEIPAALKNAVDYLYQEWTYKPAGIVSYGGMSAGTRAAQSLRGILSILKVVPMVEAVYLPFFTKQMDEGGRFNGDEANAKAVKVMLSELEKWAVALKALRADVNKPAR